MTNSMWVILLYFFARPSPQSCFIPSPTGSEWLYFIFLPGSPINCVSSHDQQHVSDAGLCLCQTLSSVIFHPMTNRMWVTLLYFFARQSHQSCFIPWPTGCEWHCFISLPGNHVSSHDQQYVSNTALFLCQALTSIMFHWPTGSEWHCCSSLPGTLINHVSSHDQQIVSDIAVVLCQELSSIMFHPMTNSLWVTLLYIFARHFHQSCFIPLPTVCEWLCCFISLPGSLINHVSSHDQLEQDVSDTALFLCHIVSSHIFHPMTNTQKASDTALFLCQAFSHQTCYSMTNSMWVAITASFVCHAVSVIDHVPFHDQQIVSLVQLFIKYISSCDQQSVSDMPSLLVIFSYCPQRVSENAFGLSSENRVFPWPHSKWVILATYL